MKSNHVTYLWEDHCHQQVKNIYDHYYEWYSTKNLEEINPIQQIELFIEYVIQETKNLTSPITPEILTTIDNNYLFFDTASYAIFILDHFNLPIDHYHITDILIRKQKDYGPQNILKFGVTGIIVRMYDKIARLKNLNKTGDITQALNNNSVNGETVIDTLIDIIGYSTIALLLLDPEETYGNKFSVPMSHQNN